MRWDGLSNDYEVKVWAEAGSNWWRDTELKAFDAACEHVELASDCGCAAVKFQLFRADTLYSDRRAPKNHEAVRRFELPLEWLLDLRKTADVCGVELWLSVFDPALVEPALPYVHGLKLASGDLAYRPLVEAVAKADKVCVSTGTMVNQEVREGLRWLYDADFTGELVIMNCVSAYPAQPEWYNLQLWEKRCWEMGAERGLSDHTDNVPMRDVAYLACLAVARGYTVFEKHFMVEGTPPELPDFPVSLAPDEMEEYVQNVKAVGGMLRGHTRAKVDKHEEKEVKWMRRGSDGKRPA